MFAKTKTLKIKLAKPSRIKFGTSYGNLKTIISTYEIAMFAKTQTQMKINWLNHMTTKKQ